MLSIGEIFAHTSAPTTNYAARYDNPQHPQLRNNIGGTGGWNLDADNDGFYNWEELDTYHTDPTKADTDGDGLDDYAEVKTHHTDPLKADTDGDGFSDGDEVKNHWDPTSWTSPWGGIIAGLFFGVGIPGAGIAYYRYRKAHPVATHSRPAPYFPRVEPAPSTSLSAFPATSRFAPAYHAPNVAGHLVPVYRGRTAVEWGSIAEALEQQGYWNQALAAVEIARQLRRVEINPPAWGRAENERATPLPRHASLPAPASTPVIDSFLAEPSPEPAPAPAPVVEITIDSPADPAPETLQPIPPPEVPVVEEPVIVPPIPDPTPVPGLHLEPALEIIPLCRLCGGLVRNGECGRCGGKVCPACKAANYATETFCRKCLTPL